MRIRNLLPTDIKMMGSIFGDVFTKREKTKLNNAWRERFVPASFGYFQDGNLVAFALSSLGGYNFQSLYIHYICVRPEVQMNGFGTILLKKVIDYANDKKMGLLLVPVARKQILSWYAKYGFNITVQKGDYMLLNKKPYPVRHHPRLTA